MNTGRRVSTAAVAQNPDSAGNRCDASTSSRGYSSAYSVSNCESAPSSVTEPADAPTTTFPCRTMTWVTASSVTASDSPALSVYSRVVRAARPR